MTRAHLLTAAAVLIACGCNESSVGPPVVEAPSPPLQLSVITGTVVTERSRPPLGVTLRLEWGEIVDVVGADVPRLVILDGAELQLSGTWISPVAPPVPVTTVRSAFKVAEFLVLAVGGRPAMDGVLGEEEGRYYLRPTAGDVFWFEAGPSEFDANIGKRIWVTGSMEDPPLRFGVIN
jgi:hypothetical protein